MKRATNTTKQSKSTRKQLGILVDERLWREFRATAIRLDKTATTFLEESMRKTLKEHGEASK